MFQTRPETDIRQLLKGSSNAFCAFDPIPTWLMKDCMDALISPITNIVNKSLSLTVLVLLDPSAAFDIVDHNALFSRLRDMFGLSGKVLEWVRSYLEQHSQRVALRGMLSDVQVLLAGVP